ncbi:MAG: hypothetical protein LLG42_13545 [Chloroflexi bacterium]|nr:hypothetical protein [Chloroflexota bacterium]
MKEIVSPTVYFQTAGPVNTERVLQLAYNRAAEIVVRSVVVATTTGATGVLAAEKFSGYNLVAVSHSTGFGGPDLQEMIPENRQKIEFTGGKVLTTTHAFGGVNRAIRRKLNTYQVDEIIAFTLRNFGDGMKVAAEIALMAADAGLIRVDEPVMTISGTGGGADTAVILLPSNAQNFFDLRFIEIICMPAPRHPLFS